MSGETVAGRYRLLEPLGRGPMSSVWLAHDDELQRRVAVKMLGVAADPARFEREARAAAALSHPNIAALYDYGEDRNRPYMVLEYLGNGSLEDRLRSGAPLPDAETLRIAVEIAAGLAHAHERGLVHRDLKPANVLFDAEQRAKIADFGIARMGDSGTLTEAGTVLGTASYISPEQAAGKPAGPQSDVYSFGVILFRMLTGELPFVSTNAMELVRRHRDEPPPHVRDIRPEANARLAAIADACLAKDPAHRPADGEALLAELRGTDATTVTQVLRPPPSRRGKQWLIPVIALVAVLLGAGIALAVLTTGGGGSGGTTAPTTQLTLPTVKTTESTPTTTAATTEPTTAATTTAPTTTTRPTTTAARPTTTSVVPPPPLPTTTVELPTTTAAAPTTTETTPTTTEELPTTTTDTTTTTP
ncbi:MAG TPA: serine/threonine-protein kinase [Gaiellaceae bacterium]|jgi:serine/threonine-protein kinase|nr:serine/threonine-protein kinase [Gaiellaceae bacterium]